MVSPHPPIAMTIAGSDPSGGAGLQADLKTFHKLGVYGCSAVSLLTVQNTLGVQAVDPLSANFVCRQVEAVRSDLDIHAAKTGALGNAEIIAAVAGMASEFAFPLVVDPVMISKHGHAIIEDEAVRVLKTELLPHAQLITPNLHEARQLTGLSIEHAKELAPASERLLELGPQAVLIKGHFGDQVVDHFTDGSETCVFESPRLDSNHTHGSGCVLSAAITANLARGHSLIHSITLARELVTRAIASAPDVGGGIHPLNLLS